MKESRFYSVNKDLIDFSFYNTVIKRENLSNIDFVNYYNKFDFKKVNWWSFENFKKYYTDQMNPLIYLDELTNNFKFTDLNVTINPFLLSKIVSLEEYKDIRILNNIDKKISFQYYDPLNDPENINLYPVNSLNNITHGLFLNPNLRNEEDHYKKYLDEIVTKNHPVITLIEPLGVISPLKLEKAIKFILNNYNFKLRLHLKSDYSTLPLLINSALKYDIKGFDVVIRSESSISTLPDLLLLKKILNFNNLDNDINLDPLVYLNKFIQISKDKQKFYKESFDFLYSDAFIHKVHVTLKECNLLNKIDLVMDEISILIKDMGKPPLVEPFASIVTTQAVLNIVHGRYSIISIQFSSYISKIYGNPAENINIADFKEKYNIKQILSKKQKTPKFPKGPKNDLLNLIFSPNEFDNYSNKKNKSISEKQDFDIVNVAEIVYQVIKLEENRKNIKEIDNQLNQEISNWKQLGRYSSMNNYFRI